MIFAVVTLFLWRSECDLYRISGIYFRHYFCEFGCLFEGITKEEASNEENSKLNKLAECFTRTKVETYITCINLAAENQMSAIAYLFKYF